MGNSLIGQFLATVILHHPHYMNQHQEIKFQGLTASLQHITAPYVVYLSSVMSHSAHQ